MTCKFPKIDIQIQANLVAGLIGKSNFSKIIDSFIRILNINAYNMTETYGEHTINDSIYYTYLETIPAKHENIIDLKNTLEAISHFNTPLCIQEKLKKHVICSFGKRHENKIIRVYLKNNSAKKNTSFKSVNIYSCKYFSITINGSPDYVDESGTILEIKNRIHSFSSQIKECDYVQLQIYLNMFKSESGKLVEGMILSEDEIKINIHDTQRDPLAYQSICNKLILPCILLYKLIIDSRLRLYFESLNKFNKNIFININFYLFNKYLEQYNSIQNIFDDIQVTELRPNPSLYRPPDGEGQRKDTTNDNAATNLQVSRQSLWPLRSRTRELFRDRRVDREPKGRPAGR